MTRGDIDKEYYADGNIPDLAEQGIAFSNDVIAAALANIYRKQFNVRTQIEPGLFRETVKKINMASATGISNAVQAGAPMPTNAFLNAIKKNNEVFAAFRTHRMQNDIAAQLIDVDGHLKSFSKFAKDVRPYTDHQNRKWLQTEYDTAVIRAHQAADWQQFEDEKDVLPNLEWMPSTSPNPGADHHPFWGTVLPIDDPFWNEHKPGDRWNCKCGLRNTDKQASIVPTGGQKDMPARGLENNPGKDGHLFSDKHGYFPDSCGTCPFAGNKLKALFADLAGKKNCYECKKVDKVAKGIKDDVIKCELPPKVETYTKNSNHVYVSPYHGENELDENMRLAEFISKETNDKVFLLPRLNPQSTIENGLRKILLPKGVPENKNADFLIQGKIFEGKSMLSIKARDRKGIKEAIENRIKKAKMQANNIILEIPTFVENEDFDSIIKNYLNRTKKQREIWVIWDNQLLKYKTPIKE